MTPYKVGCVRGSLEITYYPWRWHHTWHSGQRGAVTTTRSQKGRDGEEAQGGHEVRGLGRGQHRERGRDLVLDRDRDWIKCVIIIWPEWQLTWSEVSLDSGTGYRERVVRSWCRLFIRNTAPSQLNIISSIIQILAIHICLVISAPFVFSLAV